MSSLPAHPHVSARRRAALALGAALVALVAGCGPDPIAAPLAVPVLPSTAAHAVVADVDPALDALARQTVGGPTSRRALVLAPFQAELRDSLDAIVDPLERMGYVVTVLTDTAATLARFRGDSLSRYGVVYIRTLASSSEQLGIRDASGVPVNTGLPVPPPEAVLLTGHVVPADPTTLLADRPAAAGALATRLDGFLAGVPRLTALRWITGGPSDSAWAATHDVLGVGVSFIEATLPTSSQMSSALFIVNAAHGAALTADRSVFFGGLTSRVRGIATLGGWTQPQDARLSALMAERFFAALAEGRSVVDAQRAARDSTTAVWMRGGGTITASTNPAAFMLTSLGANFFVRPADSLVVGITATDARGRVVSIDSLAAGDSVRAAGVLYLDGQPVSRRVTLAATPSAPLRFDRGDMTVAGLGPFGFVATVEGGLAVAPRPVRAIARYPRRLASAAAWSYTPALGGSAASPTIVAGQTATLAPTAQDLGTGRIVPLEAYEIAMTSSDPTVLRTETDAQHRWIVRALRPGTVTVTGTLGAGGATTTQTVTVTPGPAYSALLIDSGPGVVALTEIDSVKHARYRASAYETISGARVDVTDLVTWSSGNPAVLRFDSTATDAALVGPGSAWVTATLGSLRSVRQGVVEQCVQSLQPGAYFTRVRVGATVAIPMAGYWRRTTACDPRFVTPTVGSAALMRFDSLASPRADGTRIGIYYFTALARGGTTATFTGRGGVTMRLPVTIVP